MLVNCVVCGRKIKISRWRKKRSKGNCCSLGCKRKWLSISMKGKNSSRWQNKYNTCKFCKRHFRVILSRTKRGWGKFCSRKCRGGWSSINKRGGENPNWKGGKRRIICKTCNKVFSAFPCRIEKERQKFCSRKCYGKWWKGYIRPQISFVGRWGGSDNPNWRGGVSKTYKLRLTKRSWFFIRQAVYRRDHWTCQSCGKQSGENRIAAHHIIPYRVSFDDSMENLITLCYSCHCKEEQKYYRRLGEAGR